MDASSGVHPEELSRRISQIDLTSLRHRANTQTENFPPRYSTEELLRLRPHDAVHDDHDTITEGMKTPHDVPRPPTNTPAHRPGTPEHHLSEISPNGVVPSVQDANGDEAEKKKKKKKSSGKNRKAPPTGFEEYYADPPTTPDEHEEEAELYNSSRSLTERLQTCIQRYRKRRNLDSVRANIFTKYLMLGGVEASTSKQFTGGLDNETLENSTAAEIAAIQATDFIRSGTKNPKYYDPAEPEHWVVDFEGVAKGFLSWGAPSRLGADTEQEIKTFCSVIKNFLNYLITHAVCPEFTQDILAARKVCDLAAKELWDIKHLRNELPGEFNIAASTLYGGLYRGITTSNQAWAKDDPFSQEYISWNRGLSNMEADRVFKAGIAFEGNDSLFHAAMMGDIHTISTETKYLEVVRIDRPNTRGIHDYSTATGGEKDKCPVKPLGKIYFKSWEGPGINNEDMTDNSDGEMSSDFNVNSFTEIFWLEDEILSHCFIGLKLEVVIHELNIGVKYFDEILGLYCSFHAILPNENVIANWKEPALNTRPPPTEDDPDAEERVLGAEMERELDADEKLLGGERDTEVAVSDTRPAKG